MSDGGWEAIRHMTLDQLVTETKLSGGGAAAVNGHTTPEGWPFSIILVLGRPSNQGAINLIAEFQRELSRRAPWEKKAEGKAWP